METFEIAWSAFACVYLIYLCDPLESPERPKAPLVPIKANGRDICVPPAFVDAISDISKFGTEFELALKRAVPELTSTGGSLWTARTVREKKPELENALRGMDKLRQNHSALLDKAIDAYDRHEDIKEDLKSHRRKQRAKMNEIQKLMEEYWPDSSSWTLL